MFGSDSRTSSRSRHVEPEPLTSGYGRRARFDESDRDGDPLLRMFGAAALAILALTAASFLLV